MVQNQDKKRLKELSEDTAFNAYLDDMFRRGMARTMEFQQLYCDAIRWMFGDQLPPEQDRQRGWEYICLNVILPTVWSEISMLASEQPRLVVTPAEGTDLQIAKGIGQALQAKWTNDLKMQMRVMQALLDGHLAGYYVGFGFWEPKARWDRRQQRWEGDIEFNIINPSYFGCDPDVELASDIPTKAKYCVLEYYIDKTYAVNKWPAFKDYLIEKGELDPNDPYWLPGGVSMSMGDGTGASNIDEGGFNRVTQTFSGRIKEGPYSIEEWASRFATLISGVGDGNNTLGGAQDTSSRVKIQVALYRSMEEETVPAVEDDFTVEEIKAGQARPLIWDEQLSKYVDEEYPITDGEGNTIGYKLWDTKKKPFPKKVTQPEYQRPKYPMGRWTIRLDGKCIVEDRKYPYENWPFIVGVNYIMPHIWQGCNSVEMAMHLQRYLNTLHTHINNNVRHHSDTQWVTETDTLATSDPTRSTVYVPNAAGSVIQVNPGKLNAIRREPPAPLPNWIFELEDILKNRIQDIQGIHDVTQGRASNGNTLGELQMLNSNSQMRIAALQVPPLHTFLQQAGYLMAELMSMHYEPGRMVRMLGPTRDAALTTMQWKSDYQTARYDIQIEATSTQPYNEQDEIARYGKATEIIGPAMFGRLLEKLKITDYEDVLREHELLGPFTQFKEMAQQMGMDQQAMMQVIIATIQNMAAQQAMQAAQRKGLPNGQSAA